MIDRGLDYFCKHTDEMGKKCKLHPIWFIARKGEGLFSVSSSGSHQVKRDILVIITFTLLYSVASLEYMYAVKFTVIACKH